MILDIERLPKEGLNISKDFDYVSGDLVEENAVFLQPVHAEVFVQKIGEEIYVKGRITTTLSFVCSRCLAPYEFPVDSNFDLVYLPQDVVEAKEELSEEDLDTNIYYGQSLDLAAIVLEQLNLTFPTKPLCSSDCEGLCAVCGEVRQDGQCACQVKGSGPGPQRPKPLNKR